MTNYLWLNDQEITECKLLNLNYSVEELYQALCPHVANKLKKNKYQKGS